MTDPYYPPAPKPGSPLRAFAEAALLGRRDLLRLLPEPAYRSLMGRSPVGRRPIFYINGPRMVRAAMVKRVRHLPKSDLMVDALKPLVGDGIFISNGDTWAKHRRMIDPAFAHMRIRTAYGQMRAATDSFLNRLDGLAESGETALLDEEMSHLTADIVFRTIFSEPIESAEARAVFHAFSAYQDAVPQVSPRVLLASRPWSGAKPPRKVEETCALIRETLGVLIDKRRASGEAKDDIAGDLIAARDAETGEGFTREELIDQIAVFFLAGHETSASALTWAFFILSQRPEFLAPLREEVAAVVGDGPIEYEHTRRLVYARNIFRETLRLYPPVSFITRVAERPMRFMGENAPRGSLVVISPWLIHRHRRFWEDPDRFDPDRFSPAREKEQSPGSYIPFGMGPRVCTGASFATTESTLILAALARWYDFETLAPETVMPVGRLTTRPKEPVKMRFRMRSA